MAEYDDDELNDMFVEEQAMRGIRPKIDIDDIEKSYMKLGEKDELTIQREKEKMEIIQRIRDARARLLKCKNVKATGARGRKINEENAKKRKKIKEEILNHQDDLDRLKMETEGSTMNHKNFATGSMDVRPENEESGPSGADIANQIGKSIISDFSFNGGGNLESASSVFS